MSDLTIYYDFASPFCYVAVEIVRRLGAMRPLTVDWKPFEVIDYLPARGAMPQNPAFVRRAEVAQATKLALRYGLPIILRERLLNSSLALCAVEHAKSRAPAGPEIRPADRLRTALFTAYYAEERDISDLQVVLDVAAACGVRDGLADALNAGTYRSVVAGSREAAQDLGVVAVPTWLASGYGVVGVPEFSEIVRLLDTAAAESPS